MPVREYADTTFREHGEVGQQNTLQLASGTHAGKVQDSLADIRFVYKRFRVSAWIGLDDTWYSAPHCPDFPIQGQRMDPNSDKKHLRSFKHLCLFSASQVLPNPVLAAILVRLVSTLYPAYRVQTTKGCQCCPSFNVVVTDSLVSGSSASRATSPIPMEEMH